MPSFILPKSFFFCSSCITNLVYLNLYDGQIMELFVSWKGNIGGSTHDFQCSVHNWTHQKEPMFWLLSLRSVLQGWQLRKNISQISWVNRTWKFLKDNKQEAVQFSDLFLNRDTIEAKRHSVCCEYDLLVLMVGSVFSKIFYMINYAQMQTSMCSNSMIGLPLTCSTTEWEFEAPSWCIGLQKSLLFTVAWSPPWLLKHNQIQFQTLYVNS